MNFNATLLGQFITFGIFVFVMVKYVWPPIMGALRERQHKIADGLEAAERGVRDLEQAKAESAKLNKQAREQAAELAAQANKRGVSIVEEAKAQARAEHDRIVASAHDEIEQERHRLREALRAEVAAIAVAGAGKILEREIDDKAHAELLDKLAAEL